jgi:hypothetical protein
MDDTESYRSGLSSDEDVNIVNEVLALRADNSDHDQIDKEPRNVVEDPFAVPEPWAGNEEPIEKEASVKRKGRRLVSSDESSDEIDNRKKRRKPKKNASFLLEKELVPDEIIPDEEERILDKLIDKCVDEENELKANSRSVPSDNDVNDHNNTKFANDSDINSNGLDGSRSKPVKKRRSVICDDSTDGESDEIHNESKVSPQHISDRDLSDQEGGRVANLKKSKLRSQELSRHRSRDGEIEQNDSKSYRNYLMRYKKKPNPQFLDQILQNIARNSIHLGIVGPPERLSSQKGNAMETEKQDDNASLELEFSDEDQHVEYDIGFKFDASDNPTSALVKFTESSLTDTAKDCKQIKIRSQSICGLYQNVGGQSSRQVMLKGIHKDARIRRTNSFSMDTN